MARTKTINSKLTNSGFVPQNPDQPPAPPPTVPPVVTPSPGSGSPTQPPGGRTPVPGAPTVPTNPGPVKPVPPPPPPSDPGGASPTPPPVPDGRGVPNGYGIGQGYLGNGIELPFWTAPSYMFGPNGPYVPPGIPVPEPDPYVPPPVGFAPPSPHAVVEPGVEPPTYEPGLAVNNSERTQAPVPFLEESRPATATKRLGSISDMLRQYRQQKGGIRTTFGG